MKEPFRHQPDEHNFDCKLCGFRLDQTATCYEARYRDKFEKADKELDRIKAALAVLSRYFPDEANR